MDATGLIKGIVLGFSVAAPVGPIGVLCIRRTLAHGRLAGLVSGLGAATADTLYGVVAASGLTLVARLLLDYSGWLRLLGGLFLCYLGIKTLLSAPASEAAARPDGGLWRNYLSTLGLTLTNPSTILSFLAMFAGLGALDGPGAAWLLVIGVFIGSAAWWLILSGGVSLLRARLDARRLRLINLAAGLVVLGFGVVTLAGI
ncbi:MAG TPA: LysE family transporter [Herpetosiphonaceae bacterium]